MAGPPSGGESRASEAGSGDEEVGYGSREEDPASGEAFHLQQAMVATARGWARQAYPRGFSFLLFFYFINRGGHQTASENSLFTATFGPRQFVVVPLNP
jgi:hypothetical protein